MTPLSVACLVGNIQAVDELLLTMSPPVSFRRYLF